MHSGTYDRKALRPYRSFTTGRTSARSDLDDALAQPFGDRLDAVRHIELLVDVLEVGAHRRPREVEHVRGFVIGKPLRDEPEDLDFAFRQGARGRLFGELRSGRRRRLRILRDVEMPEEPSGQGRLDDAP